MSRKRIALLVAIALLPVLAGAGMALLDVWRSSNLFITTRDAHVAARIIHAQSAVAGQIGQYNVRVGDSVQEGAVVAWVTGPSRARVNVRAPLSGTVLSLPAGEGASVPPGQAVVTIGDLEEIWVDANIEESRAVQVRVGQPVQVRIEPSGATLAGIVAEVTPATQSMLGSGSGGNAGNNGSGGRNASANTRVTQTVPVRIALELPEGTALPTLYPGMSAEVRISLR